MPDTALLLDHVRLGIRPLIVCDIDEVVLEFITPLKAFLRANGYDFIARAYKLKGNIISVTDGTEIEQAQISDLLEAFFLSQHDWQTPAEHAVETLHSLADEADIVFLTAMAPRHQAVRRALLDSFDLPFPLVATEDAKGPVVDRLHNRRALPVAFLDDIERNHLSVQTHVPDCLLVSLMANQELRALAPALGDGIQMATGWTHAAELLRAHMAAKA